MSTVTSPANLLLRAAALLAVALALPALAATPYGSWTPIGPDGANLGVVHRNSAEISRLVAPSGYLVYTSTNDGMTWQAAAPLPSFATAVDGGNAVAFDPTDAQHFLLAARVDATYSSSIFETRDFGATWSLRATWPGKIGAIAIDPLDVRHLWAYTTDSGQSTESWRNESFDGGATWPVSSINRSCGSDADGVRAVAPRTTPDGDMYELEAVECSHPFFGLRLPKLVRYNANEPLTGGHTFSEFASSNVARLAVFGNTLYIRRGELLYRSTDRGDTVTLLRFDISDFDAKGPNELWITTPSGPFHSTDGGTSWSPLSTEVKGLGALRGTRSIRANGSSIVIGGVDGVVRSTDGGGTWQQSSKGLTGVGVRNLNHADDGQTLFVASDTYPNQSLYRSIDGGQTWTWGNVVPYVRWMRMVVADPSTTGPLATRRYFASGYGCAIGDTACAQAFPSRPSGSVYVSNDGGASWGSFNEGMPPHNAPEATGIMRALAVFPAPGGGMRVHTGGQSASGAWTAPWRDVGSLSWQTSSGFPNRNSVGRSSVMGFVRDAAVPGRLYASTEFLQLGAIAPFESGVFRSDDGGQTWQQKSNGIPVMPGYTNTRDSMLAIVADAFTAGRVWATLANSKNDRPRSRVFVTNDAGESWSECGPLPAGTDLRGLAQHDTLPNVVMAADLGEVPGYGGAWVSADACRTWQRFGDPVLLGAYNITQRGSTVYLGTSSLGILTRPFALEVISADGFE